MDLLLHSKPQKIKVQFGGKMVNLTFEGIIDKFTRKYIAPAKFTPSERTQKAVAPFMTFGPCSLCKGTRLSQAALSSKINGRSIAELSAMEVDELIDVIKAVETPEAAPIVATITKRLQHLIDIGLEYLSLDRETDSLSGGESQRIKMVKHLGSSLVDVMYVFDEPSIGLHPRDVHRLNELLQKLRDKGNTVIVVEHDRDVIKIADHIVDVGPHAGSGGGAIVFEGNFADLLHADTLTGRHIKQTMPLKDNFRLKKGNLAITNARVNNLQNVSVDIPIGVLTVVTGVAGSGKSSLIHQVFLRQHPDAIMIDQSGVAPTAPTPPRIPV
jgi:excinuclease ABC A subunit